MTRSGVCVVVCIIGLHLGRVDGERVLGKEVVISKRRVVRSSTSCVCVAIYTAGDLALQYPASTPIGI